MHYIWTYLVVGEGVTCCVVPEFARCLWDARRGLEVSDLPVQLGAVLIVLAMAGWWSTDHELGLVSLEVSA